MWNVATGRWEGNAARSLPALHAARLMRLACQKHHRKMYTLCNFSMYFLPICNNVHTVESTSKTPCTNSISITPFQMLPCAVDWAFRSNVCHQLRLVHCLEPIQRNVPQQTTVGRWMDLIRSSFYTPTISKEVKAKNIEKPSQNLTKPGEWPHPPSKRARPEYDAWSWI